YNAMFFLVIASTPSGELEHRIYQQPQRKDISAYQPEMDRFSHLTIYTALRCLKISGSLWPRYGDPENLLFRQSDFTTPANSALLRDLWSLPDPDTHALTGHLVLSSLAPIVEVPLLSDLVNQGQVRPLHGDQES